MKPTIFSCLSSMLFLLTCQPVSADLCYESATGNSNFLPGYNVSTTQYLGSRFTVTEHTNVNQIGGVFSTIDQGTVFGAIVDLGSGTLPTGSTLNPSEVVYSTVFTPVGSGDFMISMSALLAPGNYALVFGSGLYGATGADWMSATGTDTSEGAGSHFRFDTDRWVPAGGAGTRFIVKGTSANVPEPTSAGILMFAGARFCLRRRGR